MTIICYRDGVMASDSEAQQYGLRAGSVRKIVRTPEGALAASHGVSCDGAAFRRWCSAGRPVDAKPIVSTDFLGLVVEPDGSAKQYDSLLNWSEVSAPFFVLGCGGSIAFGAMAYGASAVRAVEIAIRYDAGCGGEIHIERLGVRD